MNPPVIREAAQAQRENQIIIGCCIGLFASGNIASGFFFGAVMLFINTQRRGCRTFYRNLISLAAIACFMWFFGQLVENWADFKAGFVDGYRFASGR